MTQEQKQPLSTMEEAWAEAKRLWAENDRLGAESNRLRADGDRLWDEGYQVVVSMAQALYGKDVVIDWKAQTVRAKKEA